jgi:hypothetical protein
MRGKFLRETVQMCSSKKYGRKEKKIKMAILIHKFKK